MWNWVERYRIEYNVVGAATVSEEKEVFKEKKRSSDNLWTFIENKC